MRTRGIWTGMVTVFIIILNGTGEKFWRSNTWHTDIITIICRSLSRYSSNSDCAESYAVNRLSNCSMASKSSDISISGWATTVSNFLDARVNQPWAAMRLLRPTSAAEIPPVWDSVFSVMLLANQPTWRRTARTTPPFLLTQPQVPGKRPEMAPTGVHGRHNNSHKRTTSCPSLGAKCSRHKPTINNYGHMPWQPRNWTQQASCGAVKTRPGGSTVHSQHALHIYFKTILNKLKHAGISIQTKQIT